MIPNLPTDNLYKFIAIGGLALFGGSVYLTVSVYNDQMLSYYVTLERALVGNQQIANANKNTVILKGVIDISLARIQSKNPANIPLQYTEDEIKKMRVELTNYQDELLIGKERYKVDLERLENLQSKMRWILGVGISVDLVVITMSAVGFALWYKRVQKPTDEMIQLQLAERQKPNTNPTP